MSIGPSPRFAVDLFAFWHPTPWGVADVSELPRLAEADPRAFWDRLLDMVAESGATSIEVTFAPFDWRTAVTAYGGVAALQRELESRSLGICGGYLPELENPAWLSPDRRTTLLTEVAAHAAFLSAVGGTSLLGSAPPRATRGSDADRVVDLAAVGRLAELYHQVGHACRREGVSFGLHTESHSAMWLERDVDLFMLATDPFLVGLCPDAAHILMGGGDPVALAARHSQRLVAAHWKDATGTVSWDLPIDPSVHAAHQELSTNPGAGLVDWSGWTRVMSRAGLIDPVLLEADASPTPVADIRSAIAYLTPLVGSAG